MTTTTRYMLACPSLLTPNGRDNPGRAICSEINLDAETQELTEDRRHFERELAALGDDAELYGITLHQYEEQIEEGEE